MKSRRTMCPPNRVPVSLCGALVRYIESAFLASYREVVCPRRNFDAPVPSSRPHRRSPSRFKGCRQRRTNRRLIPMIRPIYAPWHCCLFSLSVMVFSLFFIFSVVAPGDRRAPAEGGLCSRGPGLSGFARVVQGLAIIPCLCGFPLHT